MATGHRSDARVGKYAGRVGTTRRQNVHFACPCGALISVEAYCSVDANSEPELAQRLLAEDLVLNSCQCAETGATHAVNIPVVYHAPENRLFILVIPEPLRHRELDERASLATAIAEDAGVDVPAYVRNFCVVYGAAGLKQHLEEQAEEAMQATRGAELAQQLELAERELDKQRETMAAQQSEFERIASELDRSGDDIAERLQSLRDRESALDRRSEELAHRSNEISQAEIRFAQPPSSSPQSRAGSKTDPFERVDMVDINLGDADRVEDSEIYEVESADEVVGEEITDTAGSQPPEDPQGATRVGGTTDVAIERWMVSREPHLKLVDVSGKVRLAASAAPEALEGLLTNRLAVKLQMHPLPTAPLVSLVIGVPEQVRGEVRNSEPFVFHFDLMADSDRAVLDALARKFTFSLELFDNDYLLVRRRTIAAELEDNASYILAAADEHATTVGEDYSFLKAVIAFEAPDYDRFGWRHHGATQFREERLQRLVTPDDVRSALAVARRFSDPEHEGYLVMVRGYSLRAWHEQRRQVIEHAIARGLWTGSTLARIAVSEGLARSRKDLVKKLQRNFVHLVADEHGLGDETIEDNWSALAREASALGITPVPHLTDSDGRDSAVAEGEISTPVPPDTDSGAGAPIISGTIAEPAPLAASDSRNIPVSDCSFDELIAHLEDKDKRLDAAVELAKQGEERAIGPVFNTLRRMTRGEAVRVLGSTPGFGDKAIAHLMDGMRSRKGFLRQGCALALSVLKGEEGIEGVCDLLISEPTEIWREIARALGEAGSVAVMSLASRLASVDSKDEAGEEVGERIAWALAHIVGNGGSQPVNTLARGRDPVAAAVAGRALELAETAVDENRQLRGTDTPREQTVNRAFSRRFFQALESAHLGGAEISDREGADLSQPAMLLDESDLMDVDDAEPLDESDLIPT